MPAPDWYHPVDYADIRLLRKVSLEARWVFFETFCGELGHKTGLVMCRPVLTASECGMPVSQVESCLSELERVGLIVRSEGERMAYHVGSLERHGPSPTTKHFKGWARELDVFDECSAKARAVAELHGYGEPIDTLSEAYPKPIESVSLQEQEQEQEQNTLELEPPKPEPKPTKPKRAAPRKPTTDEVFDALVDKGMPRHIAEREADKFVGYYEANGWKVGRNPMKSWRGAVATWYRNWQERNPQQAGVQQRPALTQLDRNGRVRDM